MQNKYTIEQYKEMANRFNSFSFTKKLEILKDSEFLILGQDHNWFNIQGKTKELKGLFEENDIYFDIQNEWDSKEIDCLLNMLDIPRTNA